MSIFSLTEGDSLVINNKPLQMDFADGDTCNVSFPNELVTVTTGKNRNTIYAKNEGGSNFELTITLMRGSNSDLFLNGLLIQQDNDFVAFPLMGGTLTKRLGDGEGNVRFDSYNLRGMVFTKNVEGKSNVSGEADQAKAVYTLKGAVATRGLF